MIDILGLLKRLSISDNAICPICYVDYFHGMEYIHKPDCQLKAAIDALESGRLVVYEKEIKPGFTVSFNSAEGPHGKT